MAQLFTYTEEEMKLLMLNLHPRLMRYIQIKLGPTWQHCAEDIFYDVMCRFLEKKTELDSKKVPGYIFMSVKNSCLNFLSRNSVEGKAIPLSSLPESSWEIIYETEFSLPDDAEQEEESLPAISEVMSFSETLPPRTREVFLKSRIEGKTQQEIAREMGITERAVRKHLMVSVQKFRKRFR